MRLVPALSLAVTLFFASRSVAYSPGRNVWARASSYGLEGVDASSLAPRHLGSDHEGVDDEGDEDHESEDEADDEESDYISGVYEKLSVMLDQVQPSVDQIQDLSQKSNDMNADEYGDQISYHLQNVINAGSSVSEAMATADSSDASKRGAERRCLKCLKKKKKKHHYKHKYCHKCKKQKHDKCGHLLKKWLECCKICVNAVLSCKAKGVKEKCGKYLPKVTGCCARVIASCGKYGVAQVFRAVAQVDMRSFAQLGFGASAIMRV